jgi:hypothetical protein
MLLGIQEQLDHKGDKEIKVTQARQEALRFRLIMLPYQPIRIQPR